MSLSNGRRRYLEVPDSCCPCHCHFVSASLSLPVCDFHFVTERSGECRCASSASTHAVCSLLACYPHGMPLPCACLSCGTHLPCTSLTQHAPSLRASCAARTSLAHHSHSMSLLCTPAVTGDEWLEAALQASLLKLPAFTSQGLALVLWALAGLQAQPPAALLTPILAAVLERVPSFCPQVTEGTAPDHTCVLLEQQARLRALVAVIAPACFGYSKRACVLWLD